MNEDRLAGAAENLAGRATAATGRLIGDDTLVARGDAHRVRGKARNIAGSIRDFLGIRPAASARRDAVRETVSTPHDAKDTIMNEDEIKGGVRYVKGKVEKAAGDVTTDTKWQADGIIDQVAGGAQNLYGRARDKAQDVLEDAPDALADAGTQAREAVRDVAQRGRALVNEHAGDNPWLLVAVAGVAGYALSWMLHGRRD